MPKEKILNDNSISFSLDDVLDIVILIDTQGTILIANKSFYETIGISEEDAVQLDFCDFVHPVDVSLVKGHLIEEQAHATEVRGFEFRLVDKQGQIIDVECNAKRVFEENRPIGLQMVLRDISRRKVLEMDHAKATTILGLAKLAEYRDEDTGAHLERIRKYSRLLANELSKSSKYKGYIKPEYIEDLFQSATLHDIGKVGISDNILLKSGKLTKEEFEEIKHHVQLGGDVLSSIDNQIDGQSFLSLGKQIAYYHHEKWDGSGYWYGLKGEEIPLSARIVALADVYDALTSKRPYKNAFTHEKAREIIVSESGTHFDPDVGAAFELCEAEFNKIRRRNNGH